jgi:uncharacterized protein (DUF4415 family)
MAKSLKRYKKGGRKRGPGRPPLEHPKALQTLRLDHDVLEHFRASGEGWLTRINAILRAVMLREKSKI